MIIAVVDIPANGKMADLESSIAQAHKSATDIYRDVKGLMRKHYLRGENGGGGVYLFETRADAEAWFHDGWADWMEGRFGVRPTLKLYDNYLTLDNTTGDITVKTSASPDAQAATAAE